VAEDPTSRAKQRNDARTRALANALRALIRDTYQDRFGSAEGAEPFPLELAFTVDPDDGWSLHFDPPLLDQLTPQLDHHEAAQGAYRDGHAYCFRCQDPACLHSRPGSTLEVFSGYDQTGCPQWTELAQFLLDQKDDRVDRLFDPAAPLITRQIRGKDLRARQLAPFGRSSKTFSLLGQVVTGYISFIDKASRERERLAITYQAVEARDASGRIALRLNRICALPDDLELAELAEGRFDYVLRAEATARDALEQLAWKLANRSADVPLGKIMGRVPEVLRKLCRDLDHGQRQSGRQTRHARERRQIRRPVDMAMADLRRVKPAQMYEDLKTRAVVICARKGRCHVFNPDGKHVTSFVVQPGDVASRVRKNRWGAMDEERATQFLDNFA